MTDFRLYSLSGMILFKDFTPPPLPRVRKIITYLKVGAVLSSQYLLQSLQWSKEKKLSYFIWKESTFACVCSLRISWAREQSRNLSDRWSAFWFHDLRTIMFKSRLWIAWSILLCCIGYFKIKTVVLPLFLALLLVTSSCYFVTWLVPSCVTETLECRFSTACL